MFMKSNGNQIISVDRESTEGLRVQQHQANLQRLRGLRPIDDDFMRGMFRDNLPLAQFVLRILLRKPDLVLTSCETQADMKRVTGARSICLDAYGSDSVGKKYDMEIQRAEYGADPHRARYHSSVMDVENLDAGQDFRELPDTYSIFITEKDFFGKGEPYYLFRNRDVKSGEELGDGASILYVNGEYRGEDDIGRLMHDFNCTDASDMNFAEMAERTRYLKETQEGVRMMCKAMEELWKEGREKGREEGRDSHLIEQVCKKLRRGLRPEEIAEALEEDVEPIMRICVAAEGFAPEYPFEEIRKKLQPC